MASQLAIIRSIQQTLKVGPVKHTVRKPESVNPEPDPFMINPDNEIKYNRRTPYDFRQPSVASTADQSRICDLLTQRDRLMELLRSAYDRIAETYMDMYGPRFEPDDVMLAIESYLAKYLP